MKKIGLFGLVFDSTNLGCLALSYSFLNILQNIAIKNDDVFDIYVYQDFEKDNIVELLRYDRLTIHSVKMPSIKSLTGFFKHVALYKQNDINFDFTAGDSFTDIYGWKCFYSRSAIKIASIMSGKSFVLGSQTYGPFNGFFSRLVACYILQHSTEVIARDELSQKRVNKLTGIDPIRTVDLAFALDYNKLAIKKERPQIGINISGLLWSSESKFKLKIKYHQYISALITLLINRKEYEIVLVPHVLSDDLSDFENDLVPCYELTQKYPSLTIAPKFKNPIEAKSYIATLECFIGSRMHSTIAAYTTQVPVLPVSYSPKFEGLFETLGYEYLISGKNDNNEMALKKTKEFLSKIPSIREELNKSKYIIEDGMNDLINVYSEQIYNKGV